MVLSPGIANNDKRVSLNFVVIYLKTAGKGKWKEPVFLLPNTFKVYKLLTNTTIKGQ
jgi:hypothetical protein